MASNIYEPGASVTVENDLEWTISALFIGGLMVLTAPLTCILSAVTWAHADHSAQIVSLFAWLARGAVAVVAVLLLAGLSFGRRAFRQAKANGRPYVLASTAFYVNIAASLLWTFTAVALLSTTESLLKHFGR
jgi:hypothetical protein